MNNNAGIWENNSITVKFVAPMSINSNTPVFSQDNLNLKRSTVRRGKTQRWEITTNLMPSNDSADFFIHNVSNNFSEVFDIYMPQLNLKNPTTATSVLTLGAGAIAGASSVTISGLASGKVLAKGEFIQFANHDKIYVVLSEVIGDGSNKTVNIFPELQSAIPVSTIMKYRNSGTVLMKAYYDLNFTLGISFTDGILSDPGSVTFIEAL